MRTTQQQVERIIATARDDLRSLAGSPLEAISTRLQEALDIAVKGNAAPKDISRLAEYCSAIIRLLPSTLGQRFQVDAVLLKAMADDWSTGPLFSAMFVPAYDREWGYARLRMPLQEPNCPFHHNVEIVFFPAPEELDSVDLLDYPWVAHEMAHSLMFWHDEELIPTVKAKLDGIAQRRQLGAIADRGRAREIFQTAQREFLSFWTPTPDHRNWSHELSADLIALWALGPCYLACFAELLQGGEHDLYHVAENHPPYALRVEALLRAVRVFRFSCSLHGLADIHGPSNQRPEARRTSRYGVFANADMIGAIAEAVLLFCKKLGVRSWAERETHKPQRPCGSDLLLEARARFSPKDPASYAEWQRVTLAQLLTL
jgi:hypothetical protein